MHRDAPGTPAALANESVELLVDARIGVDALDSAGAGRELVAENTDDPIGMSIPELITLMTRSDTVPPLRL